MLQINSEMFAQIMERFDRIERALERMNKLKECLDGDTLLDNYDLCRLLGITKRTLARYRQKKLVTYYMIDGTTRHPKWRRSSTKRASHCRRGSDISQMFN